MSIGLHAITKATDIYGSIRGEFKLLSGTVCDEVLRNPGEAYGHLRKVPLRCVWLTNGASDGGQNKPTSLAGG